MSARGEKQLRKHEGIQITSRLTTIPTEQSFRLWNEHLRSNYALSLAYRAWELRRIRHSAATAMTAGEAEI